MATPIKTPITQILIGDPVDPPSANQPHLDLEQNIDEILAFLTNSAATGYFDQDLDTTTGLTFGYSGGVVSEGPRTAIIAGGTKVLPASQISYIYIYNIAVGNYAIENSTSDPSNTYSSVYPLWKVTTDGSGITDVTDLRSPFRDHWTLINNELYFNGRVGIGIEDPISQLHIKSASDDVFSIETSSVSGNPTINFIQSGTLRSKIWHNDTGDILTINSLFGGVNITPNNGVSAYLNVTTDGTTIDIGGASASYDFFIKTGATTLFNIDGTGRIYSYEDAYIGLLSGATTSNVYVRRDAQDHPLITEYDIDGTVKDAYKFHMADISNYALTPVGGASGSISNSWLSLTVAGVGEYITFRITRNLLFRPLVWSERRKIKASIQLNASSAWTADGFWTLGDHDNVGFGFRFNGGLIYGRVHDGSGSTDLSTGVSIPASTSTDFVLEAEWIPGTGTKFYINGVYEGQIAVGTRDLSAAVSNPDQIEAYLDAIGASTSHSIRVGSVIWTQY